MPIEAKPDFVKMERDILALWDERDCFTKLREKNKDNKRFRFLDGPITANNPMRMASSYPNLFASSGVISPGLNA